MKPITDLTKRNAQEICDLIEEDFFHSLEKFISFVQIRMDQGMNGVKFLCIHQNGRIYFDVPATGRIEVINTIPVIDYLRQEGFFLPAKTF